MMAVLVSVLFSVLFSVLVLVWFLFEGEMLISGL